MILDKVAKEIERFRKKVFYSGKTHKRLEELQYELDNLPYELYDKIQKGYADIQIPRIKSIEETLNKIINDRCSIARFGDGEFSCINRSRIAFHDPSESLANRLKQVLSSDLPDLLIGLPDCFGSLDCYVPYTKKFWRKYMSKKRQKTYALLDMNKTYYNAFFNRYYLNFNKTDEYYQKCSAYFKKLKQIWENKDVVLLESRHARLGLTNDILDGAKSVSRITFQPIRNSFDKYDDILSAFDGIEKDRLILAALGPTATVLAYDLCVKGYQTIDIGHICEEYECFLRKETPLELKSLGKNKKMRPDSDPNDPEYKKQIIKEIV